MSAPPASPALSDAEVRETLDMLGTLVASMSDRLDAQTNALDRLTKSTAEARQAAFAAQAQTDPQRYGDVLAQTLDTKLGGVATAMAQIARKLGVQTDKTIEALARSEDDRSRAHRAVFEREQKADRLKRALPWLGLGAGVLALAMTVTLPRFVVSNGTTCALLVTCSPETSAN